MIRKQLYIDDDLEHELKALAERTGQSEAEHVRRALRAYLEDRTDRRTGLDPLLGLIGLADDADEPTDVALEHDHYLYGVPKKHTAP